MMTENNFFTLARKWAGFYKSYENPPHFYRQHMDLRNKDFIPFDELSAFSKKFPINNCIPHFFIADEKQVAFASNPLKDSDLISKSYAIFSTDFSAFANTFPEFNNAMILLNRLIASYWQQSDRFVIMTFSWGDERTYETAFSNIDKGIIAGISTEGVRDWVCFKSGFLEMLRQIEPSKICWYDQIPLWVYDYYLKENIISLPKRFTRIKGISDENNKNLIFEKCQIAVTEICN